MSRVGVTSGGACWCVAAAVAVVAAGCGPRPPATGTAAGRVTYDGLPVGNGTIAFLPEDGAGPTAGGIIESGTYRVERLHPGPKIVRIEAFERQVAFPRSRADMERGAAGRATRPAPSEPPQNPNVIAAGAVGNNATVTIVVGPQVLDFTLRPPAAPE